MPRSICTGEHTIFGMSYSCAKYQELTGMPCPATPDGKAAHEAVMKAAEEIKIVDEATLGKNSVETEPYDPYCERYASQIPEVVTYAEIEEMTPAEFARDDGTYNSESGHFACNECYIKLGQPSNRYGWKAT